MNSHSDERSEDAAATGDDAKIEALTPADLPAAHPAAKDLASDNGKEEIFDFPCDFPIKIMGKTHPDFADTIMAVVEQHAPEFDRAKVEVRPSSNGNYTGLTITFVAHSRAQLDAVYLALTGHPMVKIVL